MPLCSKSQVVTLGSWGFIPVGGKYKKELLGVASTVYQGLKEEKKNPPDPADCVGPLTSALKSNSDFSSRLRASVNLKPDSYEYFTWMMARYLLDQFWFDIQEI
jgi:hypothetical protein